MHTTFRDLVYFQLQTSFDSLPPGSFVILGAFANISRSDCYIPHVSPTIRLSLCVQGTPRFAMEEI